VEDYETNPSNPFSFDFSTTQLYSPSQLTAIQPQHASHSHHRRLVILSIATLTSGVSTDIPTPTFTNGPVANPTSAPGFKGEDKKIVGSCKLLEKHKLH
jgi:hypothetical protein